MALLKRTSLGPGPRLSGLAGGGWGLLLCIYNEFPGNADAAGKRGTQFENRSPQVGPRKEPQALICSKISSCASPFGSVQTIHTM